jgi:hypothetical protein
MSSFKNFVIWLNNRLMGLYPAIYQEEFAEEMQDVFSQIVSDAAELGDLKIAFLFLREIRDYPVNLFREHWLNITRKEPVMATNSPSVNVNTCPRCGFVRADEARYCASCGRAFIPFHESLLEKLKHLVNTKLFLIVCCLASMAILIPWATDLIINRLYHPISLIALSVLASGFCLVLGWRLARKKSNIMGLLIITLISVFLGLTFLGLGAVDRVYLRSAINESKTFTYNILGMDTYVTQLETDETYAAPCESRDPECFSDILDLGPSEARSSIELPEPEFISTVCEDNSLSCMIRYMTIFSELEKPKLLIERSWKLSEQAFHVMFITYVIGLTLIAYRITPKSTGERLAAG